MLDFKTHKISSPIGLMLDSLVYNRHGEIHAIRINDLHAFDHPDMGGNYGLYGIPLTEEWFLRMGAKKWGRDDIPVTVSFEFRMLSLQYWEKGACWGWMFNKTKENDSNSWEPKVRIEFVHQLQNLYFALTGEELIIKD